MATDTVVIKLDDQEITLKPTMQVARMVSRQYGGLRQAREMLVNENFDAVAFLIRVGSGMRDREARDLDDKIYETGLSGELLIGLINFVAMLGNKGKAISLTDNDEDNSSSSSGSSQE